MVMPEDGMERGERQVKDLAGPIFLMAMINVFFLLFFIVPGLLFMPVAAGCAYRSARRRGASSRRLALTAATYSAMFFLPAVHLLLELHSASKALSVVKLLLALLRFILYSNWIVLLFLLLGAGIELANSGKGYPQAPGGAVWMAAAAVGLVLWIQSVWRLALSNSVGIAPSELGSLPWRRVETFASFVVFMASLFVMFIPTFSSAVTFPALVAMLVVLLAWTGLMIRQAVREYREQDPH